MRRFSVYLKIKELSKTHQKSTFSLCLLTPDDPPVVTTPFRRSAFPKKYHTGDSTSAMDRKNIFIIDQRYVYRSGADLVVETSSTYACLKPQSCHGGTRIAGRLVLKR